MPKPKKPQPDPTVEERLSIIEDNEQHCSARFRMVVSLLREKDAEINALKERLAKLQQQVQSIDDRNPVV